jgi:ketosteroid isomerase-like protein
MITTELGYLAWAAAFTGLMWMPYILNLIAVRGLIAAVGYPVDPKPLAPWAARMKQAHANAIENLVVFGLLVLVAHAARVSTQGGASKQIVRIESPLVRIYGDTAVVSFIRLVNAFPFNQLPRPQSSAWATMVLVKESNEWKIAHHHMSPIGS